jgi:glucans biosynthesis protein
MREFSYFPGVPCCGARTRAGGSCMGPAMPNGRCRMHGGKSPGAPKGNRNAWKHGMRSAAAREWRRQLRELIAESKKLVQVT